MNRVRWSRFGSNERRLSRLCRLAAATDALSQQMAQTRTTPCSRSVAFCDRARAVCRALRPKNSKPRACGAWWSYQSLAQKTGTRTGTGVRAEQTGAARASAPAFESSGGAPGPSGNAEPNGVVGGDLPGPGPPSAFTAPPAGAAPAVPAWGATWLR